MACVNPDQDIAPELPGDRTLISRGLGIDLETVDACPSSDSFIHLVQIILNYLNHARPRMAFSGLGIYSVGNL